MPETVQIKLSRQARRALAKAKRKPSQRVQHHRSRNQILKEDGFRAFAALIPVTEDEHRHMDTFLLLRYKMCRNGEGDSEAWGCLLECLFEGWMLVSRGDVVNPDTAKRLVRSAAKAWDAALVHFKQTGEIAEPNMDQLLTAINTILDLKKSYRRSELLQLTEYIEAHTDQMVLELFDGEAPKSGWEFRNPELRKRFSHD